MQVVDQAAILPFRESLNKLAFSYTLVEFSVDWLGIFSNAAVELCERWV